MRSWHFRILTTNLFAILTALALVGCGGGPKEDVNDGDDGPIQGSRAKKKKKKVDEEVVEKPKKDGDNVVKADKKKPSGETKERPSKGGGKKVVVAGTGVLKGKVTLEGDKPDLGAKNAELLAAIEKS